MNTLWSALRQRLSTGRRTAAAPHPAQRTFVAVGYPKVGNTWLRLTLGRYLQECYGLAEMPLMEPSEVPVLARHGVRAIGDFIHSPLDWTTQTAADLSYDNVVAPFRHIRVVLLARHPLDTLVSLYMHKHFQSSDSPFAGSLTEFLQHPVFSLDKLLRFYRIWSEAAGDVEALHVWRYEDARAYPLEELTRLLTFLQEPVRPDIAKRAVKFASFENVSAMELSAQPPVYKSSGYPVFSTGDSSNPNARHVRKGRVGGYRDEIPGALLESLEQRVKQGMPPEFLRS